MSSRPIKDEIRKFIHSNFMLSDDLRDFKDEDSFLKKGIIDSMGVMELMGFVQRHYRIRVEPSEAVPQNFDSLEHLSQFIFKKTRNGNE